MTDFLMSSKYLFPGNEGQTVLISIWKEEVVTS